MAAAIYPCEENNLKHFQQSIFLFDILLFIVWEIGKLMISNFQFKILFSFLELYTLAISPIIGEQNDLKHFQQSFFYLNIYFCLSFGKLENFIPVSGIYCCHYARI